MLNDGKNHVDVGVADVRHKPEPGRTTSVFGRARVLVPCAAMAGLLSGCKLLGFGVAATVGVVAVAGYAVYKTGDAVVTGVGKAGKATASVVFFNGDFKTQYSGNVQTVWAASRLAFLKAGLREVQGSFDALSGGLTANTREGTEIRLKLKNIDPQTTEASIRVGVTGDLKTSEALHGLILQELPASAQPQAMPAPAKEVKP